MAAADSAHGDPLLSFRQCNLSRAVPVITTSADIGDVQNELDLATATHVHFQLSDGSKATFQLSAATRFMATTENCAANLRSVIWAWQMRDELISDYFKSTADLNERLAASSQNANSKVLQLSFVERLSLTSWLEGAMDDCPNVQPLPDEAAAQQAAAAARIAAGTTAGAAAVSSSTVAGFGGAKTVDPRLAEIYKYERTMGDRNTVLRGIKATDFSHVRKYANEMFLGRTRQRPGGPTPVAPPSTNSALVSGRTKTSGRRVEPIILLSPSASSLLRTSNIRNFLEHGVYVPADSPLASGTDSGVTYMNRVLHSIDPVRPLKFILVDNLDNFKPDYWARVVAVFTTGQTWQFNKYKWTNPPELFTHALGIYVGFNGELVPGTIKGWGRGVKVASVDKWNPAQGERNRWRDREVVETIWTAIEESMRSKGWNKDGLR